MSNNVLEVSSLCTEFQSGNGRITAISDVSFSLEKGKVIGIVGESGCGKSVTSLTIMGLLPPKNSIVSNGSILLEGRELLTIKPQELCEIRGKEMAMIFQEPMTALNPVFTIGYQIGEVLDLHLGMKGKGKQERTIELLKQVGIPRAEEVVKHYPHQLSGGMKQRVMIAMAVACKPKLLIADEPTTALDVTIQAQILDLLRSLIDKNNMSVIFITHDLGVIAEIADEVAVMYGGKIVEIASVNQIFDYPLHPYTRGLMRSRPSLVAKGEKLSCIKGMVPSLKNMPAGCAFAPRCDKATEICFNSVPQLLEVDKKHYVRCFLL